MISQELVPAPPGVDSSSRRLLHPELLILPKEQGGVRATILEGRYHQLVSAMESMGREGSGVYYSFEQTDKMLREPADGTFRSTATPKDHGSSRKPSEVNQAEVAPGSGGKKGLFGFRNH